MLPVYVYAYYIFDEKHVVIWKWAAHSSLYCLAKSIKNLDVFVMGIDDNDNDNDNFINKRIKRA